MREYACAQESHPALSMRHACPSSDSSNTTASHNSSSFAILFPRRGHYHQSTPDQEGTNIPLLPPSGPPAALLPHIVNNNIYLLQQPRCYCGPRQLVFLFLVFTRFQHSTFDSGLGPDSWGQKARTRWVAAHSSGTNAGDWLQVTK